MTAAKLIEELKKPPPEAMVRIWRVDGAEDDEEYLADVEIVTFNTWDNEISLHG